MVTPKLWPVAQTRDAALIDFLWGNWGQSLLPVPEHWHLIFPSTKHENVFCFFSQDNLNVGPEPQSPGVLSCLKVIVVYFFFPRS